MRFLDIALITFLCASPTSFCRRARYLTASLAYNQTAQALETDTTISAPAKTISEPVIPLTKEQPQQETTLTFNVIATIIHYEYCGYPGVKVKCIYGPQNYKLASMAIISGESTFVADFGRKEYWSYLEEEYLTSVQFDIEAENPYVIRRLAQTHHNSKVTVAVDGKSGDESPSRYPPASVRELDPNSYNLDRIVAALIFSGRYIPAFRLMHSLVDFIGEMIDEADYFPCNTDLSAFVFNPKSQKFRVSDIQSLNKNKDKLHSCGDIYYERPICIIRPAATLLPENP
eukprot:TRINITY_DN56_c0_g1_i10.p2 TRINITY_DN56_c0_g1~~TRINITY_DN56_c0_g1_i10.p2  ORF type:complete len:287 (+),score=4.12 TRINITY_DN56_c0_g1_i10:202-1062(+)